MPIPPLKQPLAYQSRACLKQNGPHVVAKAGHLRQADVFRVVSSPGPPVRH